MRLDNAESVLGHNSGSSHKDIPNLHSLVGETVKLH